MKKLFKNHLPRKFLENINITLGFKKLLKTSIFNNENKKDTLIKVSF